MSKSATQFISRVLVLTMLVASVVPVLQHVCAQKSVSRSHCEHASDSAASAQFDRMEAPGTSDDVHGDHACCVIGEMADDERSEALPLTVGNRNAVDQNATVIAIVDPPQRHLCSLPVEVPVGRYTNVPLHLSNSVSLR